MRPSLILPNIAILPDYSESIRMSFAVICVRNGLEWNVTNVCFFFSGNRRFICGGYQ